MKTIIDTTGKVLYATSIDIDLQENEIAIDDLLQDNFVSAYWNFETRTFYENATSQEINNSIKIPQEVQLWRARTVLKLLGMEQVIEVALNSLDEPLKTGALYIWQFGTTVERNSQTVLLLQTVLGLTDAQVDDIFIQAENIAL